MEYFHILSFFAVLFTGMLIFSSIASAQTETAPALLAPLKQISSGIASTNVTCKPGLQLVIKKENSSPACVKSTTMEMLIKIGWALSMENNPSESIFMYKSCGEEHESYNSICSEAVLVNLPQKFIMSSINISNNREIITLYSHYFSVKLNQGNSILYKLNTTFPIIFNIWLDNQTGIKINDALSDNKHWTSIMNENNTQSHQKKFVAYQTGVYIFEFEPISPKPIVNVTFLAAKQ